MDDLKLDIHLVIDNSGSEVREELSPLHTHLFGNTLQLMV